MGWGGGENQSERRQTEMKAERGCLEVLCPGCVCGCVFAVHCAGDVCLHVDNGGWPVACLLGRPGGILS